MTSLNGIKGQTKEKRGRVGSGPMAPGMLEGKLLTPRAAKTSLAALAVLALVGQGCTLTPGEGQFVCSGDADCPGGWHCRDRRCYSGEPENRPLGSDSSTAMPDTNPPGQGDSSTPSEGDTGTREPGDTRERDTGNGSGQETATGSTTDTYTETGTGTGTDTGTGTGGDVDTETAAPTEPPPASDTRTGADTSDLDTGPGTDSAVSTDSQTALPETECQCEVDSGPCCADDCRFYTAEAEQVCDSWVEQRCGNAACGAPIQERTHIVYCTGLTSLCDGSGVHSRWEDVAVCNQTQKCVMSDAVPACEPDPACQ
jgi:hypothetical protein